MSDQDVLSDDYVSRLLVEDAKASVARYASCGVQTLVTRRSANNAPKPNTRFLRNIIKETDSHNAALKTREAEESRARFRKLRRLDSRSDYATPREGRLSPVQFYKAKQRVSIDDGEEAVDEGLNSALPEKSRLRDPIRDQIQGRRKDRNPDGNREDAVYVRDDGYERLRHNRHHHSRKYRHRSPDDPRERGIRGHKVKSRKRSRSHSPESKGKELHNGGGQDQRSEPASRFISSRFRSPGENNGKSVKISTLPDMIVKPNRSRRKRSGSRTSDSDPLEAIIGPPPPSLAPKVTARGRGTFASNSAIDSHFAAHYDPSKDVQIEPESDDDWDQALEALRDRQKWQTMGAERLKSAGFTEDEVAKWEKGGEKTEEDVRWRESGEGREWDRGKVIVDDGVETAAEWGRLKGR